MVDDAQPAAVVIATLAGEGQMGLAKEWAIHFKPDAPKLSRVRERGGKLCKNVSHVLTGPGPAVR